MVMLTVLKMAPNFPLTSIHQMMIPTYKVWPLMMMVPKCMLLEIPEMPYYSIHWVHRMKSVELLPLKEVFDVSSYDGTPTDVMFNPAGTKMYLAGNDNDMVQ